MSTIEHDLNELYGRIGRALEERIDQLAIRKRDITVEDHALLANHWAALNAVKWYIESNQR